MYDISREDVVFKTQDGDPRIIRFTSPFRSGCPEVDSARALLFHAKGTGNPVIFVHGLARRGLSPQIFYLRKLSSHGITTLMPILPFHEDRVSPEHKYADTFLNGPLEVMERKFFQAVSDVLTCVDYHERAGHSQVDIMGISSGRMIATIAIAHDPRIRKGVLIITGGNLEIVSWKSIAMRIYRTKNRGRKSQEFERSMKIRNDFEECARSFNSVQDLANIPTFFRYDPSLFAKLIRREKLIMFNALFDPFIPHESADDLWHRFGEPKRHLLPSVHLSAHILFKRYIFRKSLDFLMKV